VECSALDTGDEFTVMAMQPPIFYICIIVSVNPLESMA